VRKKGKVMRIYLPAEAADMFQEVRKESKLSLRKFVQGLYTVL
jgi:hypothetical protein